MHYTITVADTGQTPCTAATVTDDLTGVLGDAAYDSDAAATVGTVSYASPTLTWTGDLNPGDIATITYSVTVDDPDTGTDMLANAVTSAAPGSTCPASGTGGSACTVTTGIITGLATATGPAAFTNITTVTLSGTPQAVVNATNVEGNTAVTWDPEIDIAVPAGAIGGTYTATITHSVS